MLNTYSIVFHPTEEIVSQVKTMKESLAKAIGWYNSKNSIAHITIGEFTATEEQLEIIKKQITTISDSITTVMVTLDHFGSYPNGAFFIAPNAESKEGLVPLMKRFHQEIRYSIVHKSTDPHISIGRRLSPESLNIAKSMFPEIELEYLCEDVVLRRFNPLVKQFEIIEHFPFNGNTKEQLVQTTLF